MKIIPTQYMVLIEPRDAIKEQSGENIIVLPEIVDKAGTLRQPYGEVIDLGPECKFAKVGDKVGFLMHNMIGFEGVNQFLIPESSIFCRFEFEDATTEPSAA